MPHEPGTTVLQKDDYLRFLNVLKPGRVVVLGDSSFVPAEYVELTRGRFPTLVVAGSDWRQNAEAAAKLFRDPKLPQRYSELLLGIESAQGGYVRPAGSSAPAPAAAMPMPTTSP